VEKIMPNWTREPPDHTILATLPILRAPTKPAIVGVITSYEMVGCNLHWYKGRSLPCEDRKCPACEMKIPWRWKGYLGFWQPAEAQHSLLEFPAAAADTIADFRSQHSTLRYAILELKRVPVKANGRVLARIKPGVTDYKIFPQAPDVEKILARIWDIPASIDPTQQKSRKALKIIARQNGFEQPELFPDATNTNN